MTPSSTASAAEPTPAPDVAPTLRVKFHANGHRTDDHSVWLRQFPGGEPRWGRCVFTFDQEATDFDWLVCYDDLAPAKTERFSRRAESLADVRRSAILTSEPASVKLYGDAFLAQFGMVVTGHEAASLGHPHAVRTQPGLRWFYGLSFDPAVQPHRGYDAIRDQPVPDKTGQVSTVCSDKRMGHTLHRRRYDFTQDLRALLPQLDVFGRGVRPINDKAEAIDPYRYHLCIENHRGAHHWTEKLSDPFLGYALPLYYGATEAEAYFPPDSFVRIDIDDPEATADLIRRLIAQDAWTQRLPAIREARRRVLEDFGPFAVLSQAIEAREDALSGEGPPRPGRVFSRHRFRRERPFAALSDWARDRRYRWSLRRGVEGA